MYSGFAPPVTVIESFGVWNVIIITLCTYLYAWLWKRKPLEAWTYLVIIICSFVWEAVSHYDLFFLTFGVFVFEVQHVNLSQIISKGKWKMDSLRRNKCQRSVYNNVYLCMNIWLDLVIHRIILLTQCFILHIKWEVHSFYAGWIK